MVNANLEIPTLNAFIKNWATVISEATVTDPARWQEIETSYHATSQALVEHAATWRARAANDLAATEASLADRLRQAGVPDDALDQETQAIAARFNNVRERLRRDQPTDPVAARAALTALQATTLELPLAIREAAKKYEVAPPDNTRKITWQALLGTSRIATIVDLEAVIANLRSQVEPAINEQKTVVIE
jgi:hypothetical protein